MKRVRRTFRHLKHHFLPHRGNRYKPGLFSVQSIAAIALVLLLAEGLYLLQSKVVLESEGFLAAVLPAALQALANEDRAEAGVAALIEDPLLAQAAQAKAEDMASKGYFAHTSPEGKKLRDFLAEAGYPYTYAGENLAVDFTESVDVETAWMNSPTHRANLLKAEYTRVGFGVARGMYQGKEVTFVAQYFATRPSEAAVATVTQPAAPAVATTPAEDRVLGTETAPIAETEPTVPEEIVAHEASGDPAVLSTSPRSVLTFMVVSITAVLALFFSIAMFLHIKMGKLQMEVLAGAAVVVGIAGAILIYNNTSAIPVTLPSSEQSASVSV